MTPLIYFAEIPDGPIKIGSTSQNPLLRIAALQTGCPWPINLIGSTPGSIDNELDLHRRFASGRMAGERFCRTDILVAEIAKILAEGLAPIIAGPMASVIDAFEGAFGESIGIPDSHARAMRTRDSIPCRYWSAVVAEAEKRGIQGITFEVLARIAKARLEAV